MKSSSRKATILRITSITVLSGLVAFVGVKISLDKAEPQNSTITPTVTAEPPMEYVTPDASQTLYNYVNIEKTSTLEEFPSEGLQKGMTVTYESQERRELEEPDFTNAEEGQIVTVPTEPMYTIELKVKDGGQLAVNKDDSVMFGRVEISDLKDVKFNGKKVDATLLQTQLEGVYAATGVDSGKIVGVPGNETAWVVARRGLPEDNLYYAILALVSEEHFAIITYDMDTKEFPDFLKKVSLK